LGVSSHHQHSTALMKGSETVITSTLFDLSMIRAVGNYSMFPTDQLFKSFRASEAEFLLRVRKGATVYAPELIPDGEGGAYLLRDEDGESLAVFKPMYEEPFSPLNPKKSVADTNPSTGELRKGIRSGEPAIREVAAYALDHLEFAGVPMTLMVDINGKTGSLQEYKQHDFESWDLGPSKYDRHQVHKIGILDLRIFNVDRHGGNILVRSLPNGNNLLIPIDHGFSLPDTFEATDVWFEWLNWPQAKTPFDRAAKTYVSKIDVARDADTLRRLGIRKECLRTMIISSLVLKKGVAGGLNLHQIASLFMTNTSGKRQKFCPSIVEKISEQLPALDDKHFWYDSGLLIDAEIRKYIHFYRKQNCSIVSETLIFSPREDQFSPRNSLRASA